MQEQIKSLAAVRLWNIAIPQWRDDIDTEWSGMVNTALQIDVTFIESLFSDHKKKVYLL